MKFFVCDVKRNNYCSGFHIDQFFNLAKKCIPKMSGGFELPMTLDIVFHQLDALSPPHPFINSSIEF